MTADKSIDSFFNTPLRRYGFAIILFGIVIAIAAILSAWGIKINLTILVVVAMFLAAWYAGLWPGILITVLIEATTIISTPVPPDSTIPKAIFGHFSVFALLIFIVLLISGRKTAERRLREQSEALRQLNETLELRVAERTAELKAANKELESFSYSVSHDLRAPLRAIDGFSAALLEDYVDVLDDEGRGYLEHVRAASRNMAQLIDDLLKLANVTRAAISRRTIDLSAISREILENLQAGQPERVAEIAVQDNITAYGDERLIRVVLQNLLENAWKFTSKLPTARITVGTQADGNANEYFVSDNGAGFDMAHADKLFGAFQRLHSANEFDGTGIGLATVERVVRRHGGSIRAESSVGNGAQFFFTL